MSVNGNFTIGTVNSEARAALYEVQMNHAHNREIKVANLWENLRLIHLVSKSEASSKKAWIFVQIILIDFLNVKVPRMYQMIADTIELIKIEKTISNHGVHLKGLKNAIQSILSEASREGR